MKKITNRAELEAALARRAEINATANAAKRDWTPDEQGEIVAINHEIDRYQLLKADEGRGGMQDPVSMNSQRQPGSRSAPSIRNPSPMTFRDITTGELIHAVGRDQPLASESDYRVSASDYMGALMGRRECQERLGATQQSNVFSGGGALILPPEMSRQIIDLARPRSAVLSAGAQMAVMANPEMKIVTVTGDPTPAARGELTEIISTEGSFAGINVVAKSIGAMTTMSRELAEDAPNAPEIAVQQMVAAMGQALDIYCLRGVAGGAGPTGLRNHPNIPKVDYTTLSSPAMYTHAIKAQTSIFKANYPGEASGLSWIYPPARLGIYGAAADTTGQPLQMPRMVEAMSQVVSGQIPDNLGNGTLTEEYFGRFEESVIFIRSAIDIQFSLEATVTNPDGSTVNVWTKNAVAIRATMRADFVVMRPSWFCVYHKVPT